MTPQSEDAGSLQSHVRHLRYAVATTTCRKTVAVMQEMLREAEDQLQSRTASNDVLLKKDLNA